MNVLVAELEEEEQGIERCEVLIKEVQEPLVISSGSLDNDCQLQACIYRCMGRLMPGKTRIWADELPDRE